MENKNKFRLKQYAIFSKGQVWNKYLKPDLEKIKEEAALSEGEPNNLQEAVIRDIKRATTIKIINRIIRLIERAEEKI